MIAQACGVMLKTYISMKRHALLQQVYYFPAGNQQMAGSVLQFIVLFDCS